MSKDKRLPSSKATNLRAYVSIARPDHWVKNAFMLPGTALAFALYADDLKNRSLGEHVFSIVVAIVAACLVASANYTINEWLDAASDRHHPTKRKRAAPRGQLNPRYVYLQYALLAALGLAIASSIGRNFFLFSVLLLVMGVIYNVPAIRSKDTPYLDVLTESLNNPIRLLLGWSAVLPVELPPISILAAYWMGGAYLMAIKRYAEYRLIGNREISARYRKSFAHYDEGKLLISAMFYALNAAFFLGIFLIKYRFEFLVSFPMIALLFSWYLGLAMGPLSSKLNPERLYWEKRFAIYICLLIALLIVLLFVDLPFLNYFVDHNNVVRRR